MRNLLFLLLLPILSCAQPRARYSFSFSLPANANVSAGVYEGDRLIRTIFNNRQFTAGNHTEFWDGLDDDMERRKYLDGLEVRVLYSNVKYEWEGVIGNTSKSKSGPTVHYGFQSFSCLFVEGNRAYYSKGYSEGNPGQSYFDLNNIQEKTQLFTGEGQKTSQQTDVIASDGKLVYWGGSDPGSMKYGSSAGKGKVSFVFATRIADNKEQVFDNGLSFKCGTGRTYKSAVSVVNDPQSDITGMAVQRKGNFLLVSRAGLGKIDVLDKSHGGVLFSINTIAQPGALAIDGDDNLWVVSGGNKVLKCKLGNGTEAPVVFSINSLQEAISIAISPDNQTLLLADAGKSQQLKAFSVQNGKPIWTLGKPGGYFENAIVTDDKFYWSNLRQTYGCSVSYAKDGSFWVVDGGNYRAQHYDASRRFVERVMFLPHMYHVFVDPKNPQRVFADLLEFNVDYSKPLLPNNGSWTLVKNWGANLPSNLYNQYMPFKPIQFSNSKTFSMLFNSNSKKFDLYELKANSLLELARESVADKSQFLATDGNLYNAPSKKDGGSINFKRWRLRNFDEGGAPVWGEVELVARLGESKESDPGYGNDGNTITPGQITSNKTLVVFDAGRGEGFHIGGIQPGSNQWTWRSAMSTSPTYTGGYPTDGYYDIGNNVKNAGITAVVADSSIFWGYKGEFWKNLQTNYWQHLHQDGLMVGLFGNTRSRDVEQVKPAESGNAINGCVVKVGDNYYLYHGEEGTHSGVHRWKISNTASIKIITIPLSEAGVEKGTMMAPGQQKAKLSAAEQTTVAWKQFPEVNDTADPYKHLWKVSAGSKSYNKFQDGDISVIFRNEIKNEAWVTRDVDVPASANWEFTCQLNYDGNNSAVEIDKAGNNRLGGQYFDLIDTRGKLLLRFYPQLDYAAKYIKMMANATVVAEGKETDLKNTLSNFQSLSITCSHGNISVAYGGFPAKSVGKLQADADAKSPALLRLYFYSTGRNYERAIAIKDIELSPL